VTKILRNNNKQTIFRVNAAAWDFFSVCTRQYLRLDGVHTESVLRPSQIWGLRLAQMFME
jgi:hypothetical protein